MEKRKRKTESKIVIDVKKIQEERNRFYQGLQQIEELKKSYQQLLAENEEERNTEVKQTLSEPASTIRVYGDKAPGREVVFADNICQCYNIGKIEKIELPSGCNYKQLRILLENRINVNHLFTNEALFLVFLLMGLDHDDSVIDSCHKILESNPNFVPKFRDVIKVFLNWGATTESLNFKEGEKKEVFPKGIRLKTPDPSKTFCSSNYSSVLDYIGEACLRNPDHYSNTHKAILLKCLFRLSLDRNFNDVMITVSSCISKVIESFNHWDSFTVLNLCRLIHDDKDHFHNQVSIITDTLPKIKRCNDLASSLCHTTFSVILNLKPQYKFPYDDEDVVKLTKLIQVNEDSEEELYRLYVLLQLLNYIVYQRSIFKNSNALRKISEKLDELKWTVSRSTRIFDAPLVKGRIMYCCAMWSLSSPGEPKKSTDFYT